MIFATIVSTNYLACAHVMGKSIKAYHPDTKTVLCLLDETIHPKLNDVPYFDEIVLAKDLGIPDFYNLVFKYSVYEASCAIKADLLLFLLNRYPDDKKFIYLDSDIKLYSPLEEIGPLLDEHSIVVTPHRTAPQDYLNSRWEEIANLKDGVFNGGFIGIKRDQESRQFLNWWASRIRQYCSINVEYGLFLDQKWLNLIPCFFENYKILRHEGYNFASWNLSQRPIVKEGNQYVVNSQPLRFIHFSGLDKWFEERLNLYIADPNHLLYQLRDEYKQEVIEYGLNSYKNIPWCYNYFNNGEFILPETKARYRDSDDLQYRIRFPLQKNNDYIQNSPIENESNPLISVVMAVYNGQEWLMDAINGILSQTYKEFEFIIINDGSIDHTRDILNSIDDNRVRVVHLKRNKGAAYCLNLAIKKAKGSWIAIHDADDVSLPERLECQVERIKINPNLIAVGSFVETISNTLPQHLLNGMTSYFNSFDSSEKMMNCLFFQSPFIHGTVLISKQAFEATGGYHPKYKVAYDWDLFMRLLEQGPIEKMKKVLYKYRIEKGSLSNQNWEDTYAEIIDLNLNYILRKNPDPTFIVLGTSRTCKNFIDALHYNNLDQIGTFKYYPYEHAQSILNQWNKSDIILVLSDELSEDLIQNLKKQGMLLNQHLFILHNGIHWLIESGGL